MDPLDGRRPEFTAEALKRRAPRDGGTFGDGPFDWTTDFTLYDRCITRGIVYSGVRSPYGNGVRIFQVPGVVVISYEMVHDTRVIYTDGRPHLNTGLKLYVRPFTLSLPWTPLEGGTLLPYECHEGNRGLANTLSAERAEDRAIEEDRRNGIIRPRRPVQDGLGVGGQPLAGAARGADDGQAGPPPAR